MNFRDTGQDLSINQRRCIEDVISLLVQPAAYLTASGRIDFCNAGFAHETQLHSGLSKKSELASLLSKKDQSTFDAFRNGQDTAPQHLVVKIRPKNSDPIFAQITSLSSLDAPDGFLCQIAPKPTASDPTLGYAMEHIDLGVWDFETASNCFTVSDAWRQMRGLGENTLINASDDAWIKDVHPDDRESLRDVFNWRTERNAKSIVIQYRHRHTSGHWIWILCRASVMEVDVDGRPVKIVGTDTDITHVKAQEENLFALTGKLQLAIEASGMGIWEFDPSTSQIHWDDRMLEIYGIEDGLLVRPDKVWETFLHPDDLADTIAYAEDCKRKNADFKRDYRIVRPNGKIRHVRSLARSVATCDAHNKLIGVNIDVTKDYLRAQELELARQQLEHDSRHDALTGLGNRRKADEVTLALFNRITSEHSYVAMHIDLDHFKQVNDTLGHSAGDYVLAVVSRKLAHIVGDLGQVFRVGGDEFTVLFETAPSDSVLKDLCENLIKALSEPMIYQDQDCSIGASIGYAIGQGPPDNPSEIFINADTALYSAKHAGRSCFKVYSRELDAEVGQFSNAREDLLDAMQNAEIICHYQPQYDAQTLEIIGAEALVRWQCPSRGLMTPDKFLPQAIQSGLLPEIDEYVFRYVADQQTQWAATGIQYPRISVNTSKERLDTETLIQRTRDVIEDHHLISFELLETAFMDQIDTQLAFKLDALRELGIRIELDDFGSGHSSISALQAIQPDRVKIDRSLVAPLETKPSQLLTLRSLSKIARLEAADIVIEGLETSMQLAAIRDLDCDALQGYTLQRPMPAIEFTALLNRTSKAAQSS